MQSSANIPSFDELPDEIKLAIFNQIKSFDDYQSLCAVGTGWKNVGSDSQHFGKHSFFRTHYRYHSDLKHFIRIADSFSLRSVRRGNYVCHWGIMTMFSDELHLAEHALRAAAFCYGSPYAMRVINMLNNLPCRTKSLIFPDTLISLYQEKSYAILTAAYQSYFHPSQWTNCKILLDQEIKNIETKLNMFISTYQTFYRENRGISLNNFKEALDLFTKNSRSILPDLMTPEFTILSATNPDFVADFNLPVFSQFYFRNQQEHKKEYWFNSDKCTKSTSEKESLFLLEQQTGRLRYFSVTS